MSIVEKSGKAAIGSKKIIHRKAKSNVPIAPNYEIQSIKTKFKTLEQKVTSLEERIAIIEASSEE